MHQEGQLILRPNRFWTHPGSFWRMPKTAEGLLEDLKESELVVFKGDLNYRKLCGDVSDSSLSVSYTLIVIGCMGSNDAFRASYWAAGQDIRHQNVGPSDLQS